MNKNSAVSTAPNDLNNDQTKLTLNCDLGETECVSESSIEHKVMPYIDMVNIACGGHAGNPQTMLATLSIAKEYSVIPGAHPSYPDKENFGRQSLSISTEQLKTSLEDQINDILRISFKLNYPIEYIKPHGALYNDLATDKSIAEVVIQTIAMVNEKYQLSLKLMVISSCFELLHPMADTYHIELIPEAFSDRRYLDNGLLTPRFLSNGEPNSAAVLDAEEAIFQTLSLHKQFVISDSGMPVNITAASVCVHGDNLAALTTTKLCKDILSSELDFERPSLDSILITLKDKSLKFLLPALAEQLKIDFDSGLVACTVAFDTLFIETKPAQMNAILFLNTTLCLFKNLLTEQQNKKTTHHELPICYEILNSAELAEFNDIADIARAASIENDEVYKRHQQATYTVEAIGFAPGFAYLAGLPKSLQLPRKSTPRKRVPKGAVAVSNDMTCIYPAPSPGGWNILGLCPLPAFDVSNPQNPVLYQVGDTVRFNPIDVEQFNALKSEADNKTCKLLDDMKNQQEPASGTFKILKLTKANNNVTVQDDGRFNASQFGLSVGGAADKNSFYWAYRILGNQDTSPALEVLFGNIEFECLASSVICITGAETQVTINGNPVPMFTTLQVKQGDLVKIGFVQAGLRLYVALQGGVFAKQFWQSSSTVLKDGVGTQLNTGSVVVVSETSQKAAANQIDVKYRYLNEEARPTFDDSIRLRLVFSSQFMQFSNPQLNAFLSNTYKVSAQSDRMGVRLEGISKATSNSNSNIENIEASAPQNTQSQLTHQINIQSEGLGLGAVQIPPNGEPIVMLVDRQTIGGYPKIGSIISQDCDKLAQAKPGTKVEFIPINHQQAKAITQT